MIEKGTLNSMKTVIKLALATNLAALALPAIAQAPAPQRTPNELAALNRVAQAAGKIARVAGRSEVAQAQPRIIVRGADDPIEVDFSHRHAVTNAPRW